MEAHCLAGQSSHRMLIYSFGTDLLSCSHNFVNKVAALRNFYSRSSKWSSIGDRK